MASIILASAGSALGASIGGSILGVSAATIGGAVGSFAGSLIDSWIVSSLAPTQRIEGARLVARIGQLHEGMPLVHGDGLGRGDDRPDFAALGLAREGQDDLYLSVLREIFGVGQKKSRAALVEPVGALAALLELLRHAVHVLQEKVGGIDQDAAVGFGVHLEAPQDRFGESLLHGASFGLGAARGAVVVVGLVEQHFGATTHELDDATARELAADWDREADDDTIAEYAIDLDIALRRAGVRDLDDDEAVAAVRAALA